MLASWSLLFLGTASFTSCGDDEDEDDAKLTAIAQKIVGTWSYDEKASNTTLGDDDFMDYIREITFNADNTLSFINRDEEVFKGTYSLSDKSLKLEGASEDHEYSIEKGEVIENGDFTDGSSYSITVTDYSVEISGDKMTLTATIETVYNNGEKSSKSTGSVTSVFNKKK